MTSTTPCAIAAAGLVVSLSALATGCKQEVAASRQGAAASRQAASASEPVSTAATGSTIARVVFVGKQNACDCTRRRVEASWAALQQALGTPAKLPVERLQIDVDGAKVAPYTKQNAVMALPAIYFVDGEARVVKLLQGEVTDTQIAAALGR